MQTFSSAAFLRVRTRCGGKYMKIKLKSATRKEHKLVCEGQTKICNKRQHATHANTHRAGMATTTRRKVSLELHLRGQADVNKNKKGKM